MEVVEARTKGFKWVNPQISFQTPALTQTSTIFPRLHLEGRTCSYLYNYANSHNHHPMCYADP